MDIFLSDSSSDISSARSSLSPPPGLFSSPPSSQDPDSSTLSSSEATTGDVGPEPVPLPKKKRKIQPKLQITRHLDLTPSAPLDGDALDLLLKSLQKRRRIVVVAGAGISVSAGSM